MRRTVLAIGLALSLTLAVTPVASGADVAWVVSARLPELLSTTDGLLVAGGNPSLALATAAPDLISLYRLGVDGRPILAGSFVPESSLTALLLDDVDFDGRTELVMSRGEEGALSVDRWLGNQRLPSEPRYAWTELRGIRAVTTKSGRLLVAAGANGGLLTYVVGGRGLEPLGAVEPRYRFELLGAADLDGDGQEELVASAGRVEIVVFRWSGAQWLRWWQNYPWGGVSGAAVGDLDQDSRPELAVASGERLLYVFARATVPSPAPAAPGATAGAVPPNTTLHLRWQGPGLLPVATAGLVFLPGGQGVSAPAELASPALVAWGAGELRILSFGSKADLTKGEVTQARYKVPELREVLPAPLADRPAEGWPRLWLRTETGLVETAVPVRLDPGRVQWETAGGRVPVPGAVVLQGKMYLPLREVAAQLGLTVKWDEVRRVTEITSPDGRVAQLTADRVPTVDGVECPEAGLVRVEGGRTLLEARGVDLLFPRKDGAIRLILSGGSRMYSGSDLL